MPRERTRKGDIPPMCEHKGTGQAYINLNGERAYLRAKFGTPVAQARYEKAIQDWLARGRQPEVPKDQITITELLNRFDDWQQKNKSVDEVLNWRPTLRALREAYGTTPAVEFDAHKFDGLIERWRASDQSRTYINTQITRIKGLFKWAVTPRYGAYVPRGVYGELTTVDAFKKGHANVREGTEVDPVDIATVEKTLQHTTRMLEAMVRLQWLTGMRPGEVVMMRPCDIDRSGDVWKYRPSKHKTQNHGIKRVVLLLPMVYAKSKMTVTAQQVISPYLFGCADGEFIFSPRRAMRERIDERTARRTTPLSCGNTATGKMDHRWTERYTTSTFTQAIKHACKQASPPPDAMKDKERIRQWHKDHAWHANQLRHAGATWIYQEFDVKTAQEMLGHADEETTRRYISLSEDSLVERVMGRGQRVATHTG